MHLVTKFFFLPYTYIKYQFNIKIVKSKVSPPPTLPLDA